MSAAVAVLVVLATGTYVFKAAGPLVVGDRALPIRLRYVIELLPAALLAALTAVSTFGDGTSLMIDARAVGLVAAGLALWRRAPFVVVILVASAATALTRLVV